MDTTNTFKYDFLIGSNNKTHKREFKKAIRTLQNLNIMGFTLNKDCLGYWGLTFENSFIISIINTKDNFIDYNKAKQIKTELQKNLKQFEVLVFEYTGNIVK